MENISLEQVIITAAVLTLLFVGFLTVWIYRKKKLNRYRVTAIKYLDDLYNAYCSGEKLKALRELPVLVKFTALSAYSHDRVAALHGEPWLEFLGKTVKSVSFQSETGRLLLILASAPPEFLHNLSDEEVDRLFLLVETWIVKHIPFEQLPAKESPLEEAGLASA